ncbi:hypothetical protein HanPI659440_Chr01g0027191 [Helianthus annuus]|nr:hypothetical protein HanPI659440_Chr01g0027191 [Helianthus annuus]
MDTTLSKTSVTSTCGYIYSPKHLLDGVTLSYVRIGSKRLVLVGRVLGNMASS